MLIKSHLWGSEVRDYEVDYQGIVNNANYFHYFDHSRAIYLKEFFNIDVKEYSKNGINIVLIKTEIFFKYPLSFGDFFYVFSKLTRDSRLKLKFIQKIFKCSYEVYALIQKDINHPRKKHAKRLLNCNCKLYDGMVGEEETIVASSESLVTTLKDGRPFLLTEFENL